MLIEAVAIPAPLRGFRSGAPAQQAFTIACEAGRIARIDPVDAHPTGTVLSAFVDLHVHIDKTYTVQEVGEAQGDLQSAIGRMQAARGRWTAGQIRERMERALQDAWRRGTRAMRTHLDWPGPDAPVALPLLCELREAWRGRIELQFVSLTGVDVFDQQGGAQARARLLRRHGGLLGAHAYRNDEVGAKLRRVFELAAQHELMLDLHVDEGLHEDALALASVAALTVEFGMQGRVTCGHACSLAIQPRARAEETLQRCAAAGIHLVALPTSNLYLQGDWSATPVQRGITRLREARDAGVNVCVATDNVADAFYPYGSYDLLETWGLAVQLAHLPDAASWLDTITASPALAMGLSWDGLLRVGAPSDLVVLQAASGHELVTPSGRQRRVVRDGALVPVA